MIEFKVDESGPSHEKPAGSDGERTVRLMEINGRVWGSLPLAVLSGMDFPARLAELYFRGPPSMTTEPNSDYRIGLRTFNLELILKWIARVLVGRPRCRFLPTPRRRAVFAALVGLLSPRQKFDLSSLEDLRPAIAEIGKIARKFWGKSIGR